MKKNKKINWIIAAVWAVFLIGMVVTSQEKWQANGIVNQETFSGAASLVVNEDKVGAKVTLKEAIHGTDGIVYRYILKTDCPSWDYEDRYATRTPISWATDDTAAVEVLIYDAQVRYEGTAYASGTYYTVPMFDGLSSEDIPLEDWEQKLISQAYMAYAADMNKTDPFRMLFIVGTFGIPVIMIPAIVVIDKLMKPKKKKEEEKEKDPTDFLDR